MYLIGKPMARLVNTQGPMTFVRMNKETRSVLEIQQSKVEHWEEWNLTDSHSAELDKSLSKPRQALS